MIQKKKVFFTLLTIAALGLLSLSCSRSPLDQPRTESFKMAEEVPSSPAASYGLTDRAAPAPTAEMASSVPKPGEPGAWQERKQVKTGYVTLEVKDLAMAETAITGKVRELGGYVESSDVAATRTILRLRVPAERLEALLEGLSSLGKTQSRQISVSDVTAQYYDLETRLKNQKLLLDQYRDLLRQSKDLEDTLEVMRRITELTTEIESAEGQFRYLSAQISLSEVTVTLELPVLQGGRLGPDLGEGMEEFGYSTLEFFYGLLFFLLGLVVYGIPVALILLLLVWLFIGKPGLWRRLRGLVK